MSEITTTTTDTEAQKESARIKRLLEICNIPLSGDLSKGLQNYQGITLMDTLKLMSLINTKQATKIVEQVDLINAELESGVRRIANPANVTEKIVRPITPAEEHMLREDRSRLLMVLTTQHRSKLMEVKLELEAIAAAEKGKGGGKKRKPGFSPIEVESQTNE